MARGRLRFAVLMDNAFSQFQEEPKVGIDRFASEQGVDVVYFGLGNLDPSNPEARSRSGFFDFVSAAEFDGLISMSSSLMNVCGEAVKEALEKLKPLPMVSIGPSVIGEDCIAAESRGGIDAIMAHLMRDHGFKDFAFVSGPASNSEAAARLDAFRAALDRAGIARGPEREFEGDFMPASGTAAVEELLGARGIKPQAIVCANDFMAIGVRDGLMARGLSVPYDVAVTGFDDITMFRSLSHQFTTIQQSFSTMGFAAASRLYDIVNGKSRGPAASFPPELVIRSSCGCVDIRDRKSAEGERPAGAYSRSLQDRIEAIRVAGVGDDEVRSLQRAWIGAIQDSMQDNRPPHELEKALMDLYAASPPGIGRQGIDAFLLKLHAILVEESAQTMFATYWRDTFDALMIRLAVDGLQGEVLADLSWSTHGHTFQEIQRRCKARRMHLLRFREGNDLSRGAEVVFSSDVEAEGGGFPDWTPGPGSWLPPGCGSLVANMVTDGGDRFGYLLLDSRAIGEQTFENMRIRLSQIHHDARIMRRVKDLNAEMAREIEIRQESERRLKDALAMVERIAVFDQLTELNNRRGFLNLAEQQIKMMKRQNDHCLFLFADLDGLKSINDRWGHKEGDIAIQGAARALRSALRDSDLVARLGGDEFTALAYKADPSSIGIIKDRISKNCDKINRELGREWKIALSVGFFHVTPDSELDVEAMMGKADAALYEEKKRGKPGPG